MVAQAVAMATMIPYFFHRVLFDRFLATVCFVACGMNFSDSYYVCKITTGCTLSESSEMLEAYTLAILERSIFEWCSNLL